MRVAFALPEQPEGEKQKKGKSKTSKQAPKTDRQEAPAESPRLDIKDKKSKSSKSDNQGTTPNTLKKGLFQKASATLEVIDRHHCELEKVRIAEHCKRDAKLFEGIFYLVEKDHETSQRLFYITLIAQAVTTILLFMVVLLLWRAEGASMSRFTDLAASSHGTLGGLAKFVPTKGHKL